MPGLINADAAVLERCYRSRKLMCEVNSLSR
jgi:hypothetical protein